MTDKELIEELSEMGRHPCRAHLPMGERLRQASDRIEDLKAEIERKDAALQAYLDAFDQATGTVYVEPIIRKAMEKQP